MMRGADAGAGIGYFARSPAHQIDERRKRGRRDPGIDHQACRVVGDRRDWGEILDDVERRRLVLDEINGLRERDDDPDGGAIGRGALSMFMPIEPDAPAWFSTTTGWPRLSLNFCPTSRALMSPAPPGGLGTMMRIGRDGRSCAVAASGSSANARSTRAGHGLDISCSLPRLESSEIRGAHPTLAYP